YVKPKIKEEADKKNITFHIYANMQIDSDREFPSSVDILWPMRNQQVISYPYVKKRVERIQMEMQQKSYKFYPLFRMPNIPSEENFCSSSQARNLLDKAFLRIGARIREENSYLPASFRPLGFQKLATLGFGTFFVTYRNIANNCPLVLWAGSSSW